MKGQIKNIYVNRCIFSLFIGGGVAFAAGSAASECGHSDEFIMSVFGSPTVGGVDTLHLRLLPLTNLLYNSLYTAPHPRRCVCAVEL